MSLRSWIFDIPERAIEERLAFFGGTSPDAPLPLAEVARAFVRGYRHVLRHGASRLHEEVRREDWYFQPFFAEGAAMGIGPTRLLRGGGARDVERLATAEARFQHLLYAGWGWWLARAPGTPALKARRVRRLHATLGAIAFDGWGFAAGFFRTSKAAGAVRCPFPDGARRRVWHQGFGRSLLFTTQSRPESIQAEIACHGDLERVEIYAGLGLGLAFLRFPDLRPCPPPPVPMSGRARAAFEQGAGFGLEARARAHPDVFERWRGGLSPGDVTWIDTVRSFASAPPEVPVAPCEQLYVEWIDRLRLRLELELEDESRLNGSAR